jgi:hypothetical protein
MIFCFSTAGADFGSWPKSGHNHSEASATQERKIFCMI